MLTPINEIKQLLWHTHKSGLKKWKLRMFSSLAIRGCMNIVETYCINLARGLFVWLWFNAKLKVISLIGWRVSQISRGNRWQRTKEDNKRQSQDTVQWHHKQIGFMLPLSPESTRATGNSLQAPMTKFAKLTVHPMVPGRICPSLQFTT